MSKNKVWQSLGELHNTEASKQKGQNEFNEQLPTISQLEKESFLSATTPRRDFLKYLGFSTAAATIAASCEMPIKNSVPYLVKPDNQTPGIPNYYATTYINGGDAIPAVVKQRDGRPIKIEGNPESSLFGGGTSAQMQASVLDLYDMTRLRHPKQKTNKGFSEIPSFEQVDKLVSDATAGKKIALLTSTINSPSSQDIINKFLAKNPGSRHVQYDEVSYSGLIQANELVYGKKAIPAYQLDKADVIVSLGADFLGTWLNPVAFTKQYTSKRSLNNGNKTMSKHIHFESILSLTGSNADDRYMHRPSETGAVALALLAGLGGAVAAPEIKNASLKAGIEKTVNELKSANGKAVVLCGSNDVNIQAVVAAINSAIGANGSTINWGATTNTRKGVDADMEKLIADMESGEITAVVIYDVNPSYSYRDSARFNKALAKTVGISLAQKLDETAENCQIVIPSHHWLESFGDAEPVSGTTSFAQPTINPMFKTRAWQTNLLKWAGENTDYETYFKTFWTGKLGGEKGYFNALEKGVVETAGSSAGASANVGAAIAAAAKIAPAQTSGYEAVLYEKVTMGRGVQANNPWLQETPDPITKTTWDNYALVSPQLYQTLFGKNLLTNGGDIDDYEVHPEKRKIKVTINGKSEDLPAMVMYGVEPNTIGIAFGYGRKSANAEDTKNNIGIAASSAGFNAYKFAGFSDTYSYTAKATAEKAKGEYVLAQNQVRGILKDNLGFERPVVYQTSLQEHTKNPKQVLHHIRHEKEKILLAEGLTDFEKDGTIYPHYDRPGIKWGMNIDLNVCTGCAACVVACTAENNVAVVGKSQVAKFHDMHWLRIDRYFVGNPENPDVVFQPMMCQHCDNAPCENVCPVAATNHSSEGLNQMTYNRCIGTRYCANNCPYKVRRFNWLDYTGSDSFKDNQKGIVEEVVYTQMMDDMTRMVLNPDVTVRSRGVIEKCSFCIQRLQATKLEAKKAQDKNMVTNVHTACSQACSTGAITFGNLNVSDSEVSKAKNADGGDRTFYVLDQLHVLPNVSYQVKLKNTDRKLADHDDHAAHADHSAGHSNEKHGEGHTDKAHEGHKEEKAKTAVH